MKIISCNVNGIRSASKKGFWEWAEKANPDVLCLQEVRAKEEQLPKTPIFFDKYHAFHSIAEKAGYSGVSMYSKKKPLKIHKEMGLEAMDKEGRFLQLDFDKLSVASVYFPSGSAKEERQAIKYEFLDYFYDLLAKNKRKRRGFVFCGDYNIAHKKIDIKNWRSNQKNSGFLPEERAWMDKLIDTLGYVDAFRVLNDKEGQYTWWSNRGNAYANNTGWRIDYQIVSPNLKDKIKKVDIFKDIKFSDHAPLIVDYSL